MSETREISIDRALPDDIRADGWAVAVHNDYRLKGENHTFWLFTKGERAVKGEGKTDAEALDQVRKIIREAREPRFTLDEFVQHLRLVPPNHLINHPGPGYRGEDGEHVEVPAWTPDMLEYLRPLFHSLKP